MGVSLEHVKRMWQLYCALWEATDASARQPLLERCLAPSVSVAVVPDTVHGYGGVQQAIAGWQAKMPGTRFHTTAVRCNQGHGMARWEVRRGDGPALMSGADYFDFAEDGRMRKIVVFED